MLFRSKHVKKLRKKLYELKKLEGIEFVHGCGKKKTTLQKSIETAKQIAVEPVVSAVPEQLDLFVSHTESEIVKTLENLDIMDITPLQAMQILYDLKKKIKA